MISKSPEELFGDFGVREFWIFNHFRNSSLVTIKIGRWWYESVEWPASIEIDRFRILVNITKQERWSLHTFIYPSSTSWSWRGWIPGNEWKINFSDSNPKSSSGDWNHSEPSSSWYPWVFLWGYGQILLSDWKFDQLDSLKLIALLLTKITQINRNWQVLFCLYLIRSQAEPYQKVSRKVFHRPVHQWTPGCRD